MKRFWKRPINWPLVAFLFVEGWKYCFPTLSDVRAAMKSVGVAILSFGPALVAMVPSLPAADAAYFYQVISPSTDRSLLEIHGAYRIKNAPQVNVSQSSLGLPESTATFYTTGTCGSSFSISISCSYRPQP